MKSDGPNERALVALVYCGVLALAFLQAWAVRHSMQSDGISYLDMGDAIARGDWSMATNAYWSPLYPALLGITLKLLHPSSHWQFTVVHIVNFVIFGFAFVCFDLFMRALIVQTHSSRVLSRWVFLVVEYSICAWLLLRMITLDRVSPDMLMAAFVFLACRQLLRLRAGHQSIGEYMVLGTVLGIGYLAKAPMFPLSLVILGIAVLCGRVQWKRRIPLVLLALFVFLCIASPYIWAISKSKGRLVISESGRVNYLFYVNHTSPGWYFQNLGTARGNYFHTARRIYASPPIYEFARPIKGTQPIWYDPSYWSDGAVPGLDPHAWLALIMSHFRVYAHLLWHYQLILLICGGLLVWLGNKRTWICVLEQWPILVLAFAGLSMYLLVFVENRYTAVFFVLIWTVLAGAVQPSDRPRILSVQLATASVLTIGLFAGLLWTTARDISNSSAYSSEYMAAEQLRKLGVGEGSKVGRIGGLLAASWARLAALTVVAEIPGDDAPDFWNSSPDQQREVIQAFRSLGVRAIVAEQINETKTIQPGMPWRRLESSGRFYALCFN